ncbi:hypothetical protein ACQ4PT_064633 [Festuca glaucescens]
MAVGGGGSDVEVAAQNEARRRRVERVALPAGMVLVQVFTVVTMLMSKVALNAGMHPLVLLVYRNLVAAAVVAPLALILIKRLSLRAYPHAEGHFRRGRLGPSDLR